MSVNCRLVSLLLAVLVLSACENAQFRNREKGALGGAAVGAGLGAIVGNQVGSTGAGIAIGSAFGAISGALVGNEMDNQNDAIAERGSRLDAQDREIEENRRIIEELKGKGIDAHSTSRGVVVNLPDVLFQFDSARLTAGARDTTRDIAQTLNGGNLKERRISIEGHTDSVGSLTYNQKLSEERAASVARALQDEGISSRRVRTRGFGESKPIASNSSDSGRQRNRRVEVILENR